MHGHLLTQIPIPACPACQVKRSFRFLINENRPNRINNCNKVKLESIQQIRIFFSSLSLNPFVCDVGRHAPSGSCLFDGNKLAVSPARRVARHCWPPMRPKRSLPHLRLVSFLVTLTLEWIELIIARIICGALASASRPYVSCVVQTPVI